MREGNGDFGNRKGVEQMSGIRREKLGRLICAGIATLALAGSAKATLVNSNTVVEDEIEYYVQTDKSVYHLGEDVEILYRGTNLSEDDVEFIFSYGPIDNTCDWMVDKDQLRIWDNLGRPATGVMTSFNLSPSGSFEYTHTWNMTYKNGDDILPGNYNVTGVLGYHPDHDRYVPVSVEITILSEPRCGDPNHPYPVGDLNQDCRVNLLDLAILASHWLECTAPECETVIEVITTTDKSTYLLGEEVTVFVTAYNPNSERVTLGGGFYFASYIMDGVYDWAEGRSAPAVITSMTIEPHDSCTWELKHGSYELGVYPLNVGTHTVVGEVVGYGESTPVEFEVRSE